jgi:hypothetical protein
MSTDFVVARGQQVVALLLSTVPLAERMLLYNMALAAWTMLPERSLPQKIPSRLLRPVLSGNAVSKIFPCH